MGAIKCSYIVKVFESSCNFVGPNKVCLLVLYEYCDDFLFTYCFETGSYSLT